MTLLFCCHANRHVRNLIIYSIICVPGYYYNKVFSSSCHCVCMYSHLLLFHLIGVLHYFCRVIPNIPFASQHFVSPFTMRWSHGVQFWPKIMGGMLRVIFRLAFCRGLWPFQLVQILESGFPLGCLEQGLYPFTRDLLWRQNTLWYLKLQRFEGYWLYQHHPACPD